jgi:hypothetical protein
MRLQRFDVQAIGEHPRGEPRRLISHLELAEPESSAFTRRGWIFQLKYDRLLILSTHTAGGTRCLAE